MISWKVAAVIGVVLLASFRARADAAEFKVWAMEAHTEGRAAKHFDPGLEAVKDAVKALDFDTYLKLKTDEHTFADDKEYRAAINAEYTLSASAPTLSKDGRYQMTLKITMPSRKKPGSEIEALSTELLLPPGKKVLVKGLKLGEGKEMVVVLSVSTLPDDPGAPDQK